MSSKNRKSGAKVPRVTDNLPPEKVKMKFSEHKYYNDMDKPIFMAGEVYELEGSEWIARWLKRGGEIVEGVMPLPEPEPQNPSQIVGQGGEQGGDNTPPTGENTPDADQGKAEGENPNANSDENKTSDENAE